MVALGAACTATLFGAVIGIPLGIIGGSTSDLQLLGVSRPTSRCSIVKTARASHSKTTVKFIGDLMGKLQSELKVIANWAASAKENFSRLKTITNTLTEGSSTEDIERTLAEIERAFTGFADVVSQIDIPQRCRALTTSWSPRLQHNPS